MTGERVDARIGLVERLTAAFGDEIDRRDPGAEIPWPNWPDVGSMVVHLGRIHRWAARIVRTGGPPLDDVTSPVAAAGVRAWYDEGRLALLDVLVEVPAHSPCWIIGDRRGTAAFWRRRMVYETVKHLVDVRASGGGRRLVAPELTPEDYADGVDELFSEFLPRSRPTLQPLPGAVLLQATDIRRTWRIGRDWTVDSGVADGRNDEPARVLARAGDLALTVWERADPLQDPVRFRVEGDLVAIAALASAPIHP